MTTWTRTRGDAGDGGYALVAVLGGMTVISLLLLATLSYALQDLKPSRADQDSKAAVAAAQAGIEEFVSRLNSDDTYYANNGVDAGNPAFTTGVSIPGTGGTAASFTYTLLTTDVQTAVDGLIRLKVTGRSRDVSRSLTATLKPDGFLRYIYVTDLEVADPALYNTGRTVKHNTLLWRRDPVSDAGSTKKYHYTWAATPAMVETVCSQYWYTARYAKTYSSTVQYIEYRQPLKENDTVDGPTVATVKTADASNKITMDCQEVQFAAGEVVDGPMHSNDSLQITGSTAFTKRATSAWGSNTAASTLATPLAAPSDGKLWWGDKSVVLPQNKPETAPLLQLPTSNTVLRRKANPLAPDNGPGCLYTGQTRIVFEGKKMRVLSPGTTSSLARCYNTSTGTRNTEQLVDIPPVIYVQAGPCGTTSVGYPRTGEDTNRKWTTKYDCSYGTAFVSGTVNTRVTVGTSHDIVITGDTTYTDGLTGSDALGLIPQGSAWVYHPVTSSGANLLASADAVRKIDAAILSVSHSFIVQNYFNGVSLSTSSDDNSKLRVRGSIVQKFRGPVGVPGTNGYLKNYIYDPRLLSAPPPFFLRPLTSPWKVTKVTA